MGRVAAVLLVERHPATAGHNAVDLDSLGKRERFNLVANGNPMTGLEHFPQMEFKGMVRKPSHRKNLVPNGQRQAKHPRGRLRVDRKTGGTPGASVRAW